MPARVLVNGIAKWDGESWSPLGSGVSRLHSGDLRYSSTLTSLETGRVRLYAAGEFVQIGGIAANDVASWGWRAWSPLESGLSVSGICREAPAPRSTTAAARLCTSAVVLDTPAGFRPRALPAGTVPAGVLFPGGLRASSCPWPSSMTRSDPLYVAGYFGAVGRSTAPIESAFIARYGCLDTHVPGDLNCDGTTNFFDVDPFITALLDPPAYAAAFPTCRHQNADLNADTLVNFFDIDPFITCLLGACP